MLPVFFGLGCLITGFVIGWQLNSKATQAYLRSQILADATPFEGEELTRLKEFVGFDGWLLSLTPEQLRWHRARAEQFVEREEKREQERGRP